ncbi:MAG: DNA replication/repair protein RecF [Clostridia bacterium]|nr:DNA replication/repair protein RecF [Clostridia bacterium]
MQAKELTLTNFRNYESAHLSFSDGINILYGDNAQGKTNILEAVYLFSMGKSNRAHRDGELILHGQPSADLSLTFADSIRESQADIRLFRSRRKQIAVNEIPVRKNSELVGRFRVVYFGPEYLGLVKEGPKARRKNMDIVISQLKPAYFSALSELKKIVESKNALLKMEHPNQAMLEIMNEKLIAVSTEIIACRSQYIQKIGSLAKEIQNEISMGKEDLSLTYQSSVGTADNLSREEIADTLRLRLSDAWQRELDLRESVIGPHREDIDYTINGKDAKAFASQGQQKTIVLVQKLAEVHLMKQETGELPVLLLDDIMSELDKKRQGFILSHIRDMQILITCTDVDGFSLDADARLFSIENGQITNC